MKHKVITLLGAAAIMLAACSGGATSAPATSAPATSAPATSAPATTDAPVATPAAETPSDTKVAAVTTGPHPYFTPWGDGVADAQKDFGLAGSIFKFPPEWSFDLENGVIETLVAQGYNAFVVFPGDPTGQNATYEELSGRGIPTVSGAGCTL